MALAQLPPRAAAAYAISGMTALLKEEVPHRKVRGIVTGSSLRRLVARTFVQQEQETIAAACAPYQFALGTRAGTDALALLLRFLTDLDAERVILQLDGLGASGLLPIAALQGGPYSFDRELEELRADSGESSFAVGQALEVVIASADEDAGSIELSECV